MKTRSKTACAPSPGGNPYRAMASVRVEPPKAGQVVTAPEAMPWSVGLAGAAGAPAPPETRPVSPRRPARRAQAGPSRRGHRRRPAGRAGVAVTADVLLARRHATDPAGDRGERAPAPVERSDAECAGEPGSPDRPPQRDRGPRPRDHPQVRGPRGDGEAG